MNNYTHPYPREEDLGKKLRSTMVTINEQLDILTKQLAEAVKNIKKCTQWVLLREWEEAKE